MAARHAQGRLADEQGGAVGPLAVGEQLEEGRGERAVTARRVEHPQQLGRRHFLGGGRRLP